KLRAAAMISSSRDCQGRCHAPPPESSRTGCSRQLETVGSCPVQVGRADDRRERATLGGLHRDGPLYGPSNTTTGCAGQLAIRIVKIDPGLVTYRAHAEHDTVAHASRKIPQIQITDCGCAPSRYPVSQGPALVPRGHDEGT